VTYLRRASPLHATRAAVASAWCVLVAGVALSFEHPLVLCVLLATVIAAAAGARVAGRVLVALAFALPFALVIALINPLVVRDGLTVIARLGSVPVLGRLDVTAEATAYGGVLALRALVVIGCFALHSAAVDPDDLLRAFRRVSFRSALTAALATRMVPVLARDARRLHDAQRCLAGEPAPRRAVLRAVAAGALDRAVDVAATLEVRGYGAARRAPRGGGRPWSRHDLAFAASAAALGLLALAAYVGNWEAFEAYPSFSAPVDSRLLVLSAVLIVCALLPFADRRGIGR
jgi:energy-coupling factor transport system permease protein